MMGGDSRRLEKTAEGESGGSAWLEMSDLTLQKYGHSFNLPEITLASREGCNSII